jgi:hypothetical protein
MITSLEHEAGTGHQHIFTGHLWRTEQNGTGSTMLRGSTVRGYINTAGPRRGHITITPIGGNRPSRVRTTGGRTSRVRVTR